MTLRNIAAASSLALTTIAVPAVHSAEALRLKMRQFEEEKPILDAHGDSMHNSFNSALFFADKNDEQEAEQCLLKPSAEKWKTI